MSVCYYLTCHHCRKFIWIAQDGLSGFGFYSGEPQTMRGLHDFFADHVLKPGHQLEFMSEHKLEDDEYMEYEEIDCPTASKAIVTEEGCSHCQGAGRLGMPPSSCPFCGGEGVRRRDALGKEGGQ